jgi:hypothetical protein
MAFTTKGKAMKSFQSSRSSFRPQVEALENRCTPTAVGLPGIDYTVFTLPSGQQVLVIQPQRLKDPLTIQQLDMITEYNQGWDVMMGAPPIYLGFPGSIGLPPLDPKK